MRHTVWIRCEVEELLEWGERAIFTCVEDVLHFPVCERRPVVCVVVTRGVLFRVGEK